MIPLIIGTLEHQMAILNNMKNHVLELTKHTYGCRVVQKALETIKASNIDDNIILPELEGNVVATIKDGNGNHVI